MKYRSARDYIHGDILYKGLIIIILINGLKHEQQCFIKFKNSRA